jgi:hypothetical protein
MKSQKQKDRLAESIAEFEAGKSKHIHNLIEE